MRRICEGCGTEHDDKWMMSYNSGLKTHWYCWECWKAGQGEAASVEIERKRKAKKEAQKRK